MKKLLQMMFRRKPKAARDGTKRDDPLGVLRTLHSTKGWRYGPTVRSQKTIGLQLNNGSYIDLREERKAARAKA